MRRGSSGINALIAVNKPCGMTSHDVVNRVRRFVGERRVGHAGTLDPDASGVLVVGIGQGTRLMGHLTAETKRYIGRITFGTQTTTDDAEGEVISSAEVPAQASDEGFARETLSALVGEHMQVPPAYSAISVNGVRLYTRARAGESVELDARPITVLSAELIALESDEQTQAVSWLCSFEVSKGCYIRAIARDLGIQIGSVAHLSALTRASSGTISLADCLSLEELEHLGSQVSERALDPVKALGLPVRELSEPELADIMTGKRIPVKGTEHSDAPVLQKGDKASLVRGTKLYGIWECQGSSLKCVINFPDGIEGVQR